jgi:hypothetical protein
MSFSIDFTSLIETYNSGIDSLIDNLGVVCYCVNPPTKSDCTNCVLNPLSKVSANIYSAGGPIPFPTGSQCPYCLGRGWIELESQVAITVMVVYDPKTFWLGSIRGRQTGANVLEGTQWKVPDGIIQLIGYTSSIAPIERANYLLINQPQYNSQKNKYKRYGDPSIEGLGQNRYFFQFMERMP